MFRRHKLLSIKSRGWRRILMNRAVERQMRACAVDRLKKNCSGRWRGSMWPWHWLHESLGCFFVSFTSINYITILGAYIARSAENPENHQKDLQWKLFIFCLARAPSLLVLAFRSLTRFGANPLSIKFHFARRKGRQWERVKGIALKCMSFNVLRREETGKSKKLLIV